MHVSGFEPGCSRVGGFGVCGPRAWGVGFPSFRGTCVSFGTCFASSEMSVISYRTSSTPPIRVRVR